jgi:hypothetical protein
VSVLPSDGRSRPPVDSTVRAILLFAMAAMSVELGILVAVQVWPAMSQTGQTAMAMISGIYAATMTTVAVALYRRRPRR